MQTLGPGSLPGGITETAAPTPWGPWPSWHLGDLLLGLVAAPGSYRASAGEVLAAPQLHPEHPWHTVGACYVFVVVNGYLPHF
jgi:hypothetical protein